MQPSAPSAPVAGPVENTVVWLGFALDDELMDCLDDLSPEQRRAAIYEAAHLTPIYGLGRAS